MTADTGRDKLALALADAEIAGDGSDATAVTVRVTDAYGNHRPGTAGGVALTPAGPATLIAANPFPLAALGGVGGGFIRSRPGTAGRVTLTATHAALGRAQVGLTVTSVRSKHLFEFCSYSRAQSKSLFRTDRCSHPHAPPSAHLT
jgi:hypothetical protein